MIQQKWSVEGRLSVRDSVFLKAPKPTERLLTAVKRALWKEKVTKAGKTPRSLVTVTRLKQLRSAAKSAERWTWGARGVSSKDSSAERDLLMRPPRRARMMRGGDKRRRSCPDVGNQACQGWLPMGMW